MGHMSKWMVLMRTVLASALALSVNTPIKSEAQPQSEAAGAYRAATAEGTLRALELFIEKYPLSQEANSAFRDIVKLTRGSVLSRSGPSGLTRGPNTKKGPVATPVKAY
jgi:hypothetical protein